MQTLREYVGDLTRSLPAVVDSLEQAYGSLERVGGPTRVYDIGQTNQRGAIYVVGNTGSAIALGYNETDLVETLYWWDVFDFGEPDYVVDLPSGIDIEKVMPALQDAIKTKKMGEIT